MTWKGVIYQGRDYSSRLEVSTNGEIRNSKTKRIYRTVANKNRLQVCVSLGSRSKKKSFKIHKCVAETFIENPHNKPEVNHIDGNSLNNNVSNLEWVTGCENAKHAYDTGISTHKLSIAQVKFIRENYSPKGKNGMSGKDLSTIFSVDISTICDIANVKRYKSIA